MTKCRVIFCENIAGTPVFIGARMRKYNNSSETEVIQFKKRSFHIHYDKPYMRRKNRYEYVIDVTNNCQITGEKLENPIPASFWDDIFSAEVPRQLATEATIQGLGGLPLMMILIVLGAGIAIGTMLGMTIF